jgi:hypothetical protein
MLGLEPFTKLNFLGIWRVIIIVTRTQNHGPRRFSVFKVFLKLHVRAVTSLASPVFKDLLMVI